LLLSTLLLISCATTQPTPGNLSDARQVNHARLAPTIATAKSWAAVQMGGVRLDALRQSTKQGRSYLPPGPLLLSWGSRRLLPQWLGLRFEVLHQARPTIGPARPGVRPDLVGSGSLRGGRTPIATPARNSAGRRPASRTATGPAGCR
jgi:hypothetical protein